MRWCPALITKGADYPMQVLAWLSARASCMRPSTSGQQAALADAGVIGYLILAIMWIRLAVHVATAVT
jgi:hypothetical protein